MGYRRKHEPFKPLPPEDRPPWVFGYIRVSHIDSAKSNLSPETQETLLRERWAREVRQSQVLGNDVGQLPQWAPVGWQLVFHENGKRDGQETTDGLFIDRAVSALKVPFDLRPAGLKLSAHLRRGDVLIVAKLDRAFRSSKDAANKLQAWLEQGIRVMFLDPDVDLGTPTGKLVVHVLAAVAEFDSNVKSERGKETVSELKRQGRRYNCGIPIGYKLHPKHSKILIPDNDERRDVLLIVQFHQRGPDGRRLSFDKISDILEERDAARENRPMRPNHKKQARWDKNAPKRRWHSTRCNRAYVLWQAGKIPPPEDEPLPEWYVRLMAQKNASQRNAKSA
jgi:DNA invertase Pin-like site-specific DNA recombinase